MAVIDWAKIHNGHFNRPLRARHPAIGSYKERAMDGGDEFSCGDSLLPPGLELIFLKMCVAEACSFQSLEYQIGGSLRFFAASDPAADGVSEAFEKIRCAAAGQRITNNARDSFWINWIRLGRGWNAKQYRKSDD